MRILITGATGLVGTEVAHACHQKGIEVNYLTTSKKKIKKEPHFRGFYWNPSTGEIDTRCLESVGAIINLAGANVFRRWTKNNKKEILDSRLNVTKLLYETLRKEEHQVGQLVTASAVGIYPHSYHKLYTEDEQEVADTFLGEVVRKWEASVDKFEDLGLRLAKVRIGIVLAKDGGALPKMQRPFDYNMGAALGRGKQWQSWIHVEDLARMFLHIIENGLTGVYNGVAPNPVTNEDLMKEIAKSAGREIWLPNVPGFVLKVALGEMAGMILHSQLVASEKIQKTGFTFQYTNFKKAFEDLDKKTGSKAGS